ncbi:MAG TPA: triose-phosphate isomerase, partial [Candidatus Paceibacterota bacterium]
MEKRLLVIANWKMYVTTPKDASRLAKAIRAEVRTARKIDCAIAPAFTLMDSVAKELKGSKIALAAQTVSAHESGAHTGDVSAEMIKALGCKSVIVGHSEVRAGGQSDASVRAAMKRSLDAGLRAVLCVGEHERDHDHGSHFTFIESQLRSAIADYAKADASKLIIAYEPIWAIGEQAQAAITPLALRETVIFIKKILTQHFGREAGMAIPILYGGSVDESNARALVEGGDVSGLLVGRASTTA